MATKEATEKKKKAGGSTKEETNKGQPEHPTCCLEHTQHKEQKRNAEWHELCGIQGFPGWKTYQGERIHTWAAELRIKRGLKFQQEVHRSFREGKINKAWLWSNAVMRKTAGISCRLGTGGDKRELGSSVWVYRKERQWDHELSQFKSCQKSQWNNPNSFYHLLPLQPNTKPC